MSGFDPIVDDTADDTQVKRSQQMMFLGLFLLILAFFILLVSISIINPIKSQKIMDNLLSEFSDNTQEVVQMIPLDSRTGIIESPEDFQKAIEGVFASILQVSKVEIVNKGKTMYVRIAEDELYNAATGRIAVSTVKFLKKIATIMSSSPAHISSTLSIYLDSTRVFGQATPTGFTERTRKVAQLAEILVRAGVAYDDISIGLQQRQSGLVTFVFDTMVITNELYLENGYVEE